MYIILMATNMMTAYRDIPSVYIEMTHMPLKQRLHFHLYHSQLENPKDEIHRIIKHLGTQYFKWEILDECQDVDEAKELLKYYIGEYKSDEMGYNLVINEDMAGENAGRYGDHRTLEEIHGKEKSDEIKAKISKKLTGNLSKIEHAKKRMEVWNPMDNPATREKERQSKMGIKNNRALWNYILTKPDGEVITIENDSLNGFCKTHKEFAKSSILWALQHGKKYKGMTVEKVLKPDKAKRVE